MSSGAVALVPEDQAGRSYSSMDVHQLNLNRIRDTLDAVHPELKQRGIDVCVRMQKIQLELDALQLDLKRTCGEFASDAYAMLKRDAALRVSQELELGRQAAETASIHRAAEATGKLTPGEQAHAALNGKKSR